MTETKTQLIIAKFKRNPIVVLLVAFSSIAIGLVAFTDALKNLKQTIHEITGPAPPADINGIWRWRDENPVGSVHTIYFDFLLKGNQLFGKVTPLSLEPIRDESHGILNGFVEGDRISFELVYEYIQEWERHDPLSGQLIPRKMSRNKFKYEGKIEGDKISFHRLSDEGFFDEIVAVKINDLTKKNSNKNSMQFNHLYDLGGHSGGTNSLSFGPEGFLSLSGGQLLASGGTQDGKLEYWDLATAESKGTKDSYNHESGSVEVKFNPEIKKGSAMLTNAKITTDKQSLYFSNRVFFSSGGSGASTYNINTKELFGPIAISHDSESIVVVKNISESKISKLTVYNNDGEIKRELDSNLPVYSAVISGNGELLATAELAVSNETWIKLWQLSSGKVNWKYSTNYKVTRMAFNNDSSLLAVASTAINEIQILNVDTGNTKKNLISIKDTGFSTLEFDSTGTQLVTASIPSGDVQIWNIFNGIVMQELKNDEIVSAIAFSHNDRLLATAGSVKGVIRVWIK